MKKVLLSLWMVSVAAHVSIGAQPSFGINAPALAGYNVTNDGAYPCSAWLNVQPNQSGSITWWTGLIDDRGNGNFSLGWGPTTYGNSMQQNETRPTCVLGLLKGGFRYDYYRSILYGSNMRSGGYSSYDIYIYVGNWGSGSNNTMTVGNPKNGSVQYVGSYAADWAGQTSYIEGGNYCVFRGLTNDTWQVTACEGPLAAFQIVGNTARGMLLVVR